MQSEFLLLFVVVFALDSITPGPAVALVMSRAASIGLIRTLPLIAGLVLGDLLLFALALSGLAALAAALGSYFAIVKWVGIFYLLFMAYKLWVASSERIQADSSTSDGLQSFGMGIILPLGNPKAVGFYAALLPTVMDVGQLTLITIIDVSLAIMFIWGTTLFVYSAVADYGRRQFSNSLLQKWLKRGSAGALVGVAGVMAARE